MFICVFEKKNKKEKLKIKNSSVMLFRCFCLFFAVAVLPTSGDIMQHTHLCGTYMIAEVRDHASSVRNENDVDKTADYTQTG